MKPSGDKRVSAPTPPPSRRPLLKAPSKLPHHMAPSNAPPPPERTSTGPRFLFALPLVPGSGQQEPRRRPLAAARLRASC